MFYHVFFCYPTTPHVWKVTLDLSCCREILNSLRTIALILKLCDILFSYQSRHPNVLANGYDYFVFGDVFVQRKQRRTFSFFCPQPVQPISSH